MRSGLSICKSVIFYILFYLVLAFLFSWYLNIYFQTITDEYPKWQQGNSVIGSSPGLYFRPTPDDVVDGNTLIRYTSSNQREVEHWVDKIEYFLYPYKSFETHEDGDLNKTVCSFDKPVPPGKDCIVNLPTTGDCTYENKYGFDKSAPCFFVKLNRIYGWEPETYNDINYLPPAMPAELIDHINGLNSSSRNQIWISCSGKPETSCDNVTDVGIISYGSLYGLPAYYYPYLNTRQYLSPLVVVQFQNPPVNCKLQIECRAWAKNIIYHGGINDRRGSFSFKLQIDTD